MSDLSSRLQSALGDSYRLEKELGGGGMSRVFLAEEVRLGRKVVIKVLPPEMGAGVNVERFEREIQLAARLQHPHIVPLLSAGAEGDLLYYMMPFIEGESLRTKLAREGELPITEALRILRDVLDALAYAHEQGVVHRDIKPDNVLLTGKHSVVTDFGVAKAVSESTGGQTLTSVGVALGTPAYMSPEQAAANPNIDHRADIYGVGAMLYEMLTGRPPFSGPNAQAVLSAHVTQAPEPPVTYRETLPGALNELILRCLAKHPADRWQKAEELVPHVEAMLTPTGGTTPTGTQPVVTPTTEAAIRRAHPVRVVGLFGLASVGVLAIVYWLLFVVGLPDWVFWGAVVLLAIGLPIMLVTAHHERRRAKARTTGQVVSGPDRGVRRWFTWRRALVGGALAFAGLGVVTAAYGVTRALGIGPAATLMTRGVLSPGDTLILVAAFDDGVGDSLLAATVTQALRIDFSQSTAFSLVPPDDVNRALEFMGREPTTPLVKDVASEVAQRLNLKAMVTGEVGRLGNAYVLSASLIAPSTGEVFAAGRETAGGEDDVVNAVDRLAKGLRERIGESLRSIRASPPLEWATTESLEALKAYTRAFAAAAAGDTERDVALLEEAIRYDSTFAEAYRRLSVALFNAGLNPARERWAAGKAFTHRNRLPEVERHLVAAYYYQYVDYQPLKAVEEYKSVLDRAPNHGAAANNLMLEYNRQRRWREAEAIGRRLVADSAETYWTLFANLLTAQLGQGHREDAEQTLDLLASRVPADPWLRVFRAEALSSWGEYEAADRVLDELDTLVAPGGAWENRRLLPQYYLDRVRGRMRDGERHAEAGMGLNEGRDGRIYLLWAIARATDRLILRGDTSGARSVMDAALQRYPLSELDPESRPHLELIHWYAAVGDLPAARRLGQQYEDDIPPGAQRLDPERHAARASIARAEGRFDDAITGYRTAHEEAFACNMCWLWELGQVHELGGEQDSAIAAYERAVSAPGLWRLPDESLWKGPTLKRLGELYEARADRERAAEYYSQFVDLWANADPELQPQVREVRERVARLVSER